MTRPLPPWDLCRLCGGGGCRHCGDTGEIVTSEDHTHGYSHENWPTR